MPRPLAKRALPALAGVLLATVLAEVALCLVLPPDDAFYVWPPGLERVFRPTPGVMPGVEGESAFRINALGLRGDAPTSASSPRVLCVGGSTTECLYLDQAETWPALLQSELGEAAWVGNAGVSGRLTRDHIVQLEHLLPQLGALDHVVLLVGVNDLMLVLGKGESYDPNALDAPGAREALLPRAFDVLPARYRDDPFPRSTCLWRFFVPRIKGTLQPAQVQDSAGSVYESWREYRMTTPTPIDGLPDLGAGLAEFRRNVTELTRICQANGTRPIFLTQPFLWSDGAPDEHEALFWMGGVGDYQSAPGASYYTSSVLAAGMAHYNTELAAVCVELGVDCLDLAAVVPQDTSAFYDDVHFNEGGARLVATHLANALAAH